MEQFKDYEEKPLIQNGGDYEEKPVDFGGVTPVRPDDYKTLSIVMICFGVLACCCCGMNPMFLIFGILAIVTGNKVSPYFAAGRYEEAQQFSAKAKKWLLIGLVTGIGWMIVYHVAYYILLQTHPEMMEEMMEQYKEMLNALGEGA